MTRMDENVVWLPRLSCGVEIGVAVDSPLYEEVIVPALKREKASRDARMSSTYKGEGRLSTVGEGCTRQQWENRIAALEEFYRNTGEDDDEEHTPFSGGGLDVEKLNTPHDVGRLCKPAPQRLGMLAERAASKRSRRPLDGGMDG